MEALCACVLRIEREAEVADPTVATQQISVGVRGGSLRHKTLITAIILHIHIHNKDIILLTMQRQDMHRVRKKYCSITLPKYIIQGNIKSDIVRLWWS